jgi:hypothetical protein
MDCAAIATWKMAFPGREKLALDFGLECNAYWEKLAAEGKCSAPETFMYSDRGMWMVKGDPDTLRELIETDEVQRLLAKGNLLLQDWAWEYAKTGDAATGHLMRYAGVGQELGLI